MTPVAVAVSISAKKEKATGASFYFGRVLFNRARARARAVAYSNTNPACVCVCVYDTLLVHQKTTCASHTIEARRPCTATRLFRTQFIYGETEPITLYQKATTPNKKAVHKVPFDFISARASVCLCDDLNCCRVDSSKAQRGRTQCKQCQQQQKPTKIAHTAANEEQLYERVYGPVGDTRKTATQKKRKTRT